jgi:Fic family protein
MNTGNINSTIVCSGTDFQIAMEIVKVLLQHAAFVFRQLPKATTTTQTQNNNPKMALYQALPNQFDRAKYLEIASQLQIPESTANKQIARFCNAGLLMRQTQGNYVKSIVHSK